MTGPTRQYDAERLRRISEVTIAHYDRAAEAYRVGTWDHDVSQNYSALLDAIEGDSPMPCDHAYLHLHARAREAGQKWLKRRRRPA